MDTVCDNSPYQLRIRLRVAALGMLVVCHVLSLGVPLQAQDDYFPLPQRNASQFGYPYSPPAADEPGVTLTRRYMLDGYPELEFNPRPQDEIWLVSTRTIPDCTQLAGTQQFTCKHPVGTAWNTVPLEQLLDVQQLNSQRANIVFVHGNRTSAFWARRRGKMAYQHLIANNPVDLPPVRFIIWSWPSDEVSGSLKDFWKKMTRSVQDGHLLGQFLGMLDPAQSVTLLTYSMGTQVGFSGVETAASRAACPPVDMIAMAPVTDCNWPHNRFQAELSSQQIGQLCFFRNPRDIAIRAYKKVCSLHCHGSFQPGADLMARLHPHARQYDVSQGVGCEHNVLGYVTQPQVRCELQTILMR